MPTVDQLRQRSTLRSATVTCTADGRDHLISQQATATGLVIGNGLSSSRRGGVLARLLRQRAGAERTTEGSHRVGRVR